MSPADRPGCLGAVCEEEPEDLQPRQNPFYHTKLLYFTILPPNQISCTQILIPFVTQTCLKTGGILDQHKVQTHACPTRAHTTPEKMDSKWVRAVVGKAVDAAEGDREAACEREAPAARPARNQGTPDDRGFLVLSLVCGFDTACGNGPDVSFYWHRLPRSYSSIYRSRRALRDVCLANKMILVCRHLHVEAMRVLDEFEASFRRRILDLSSSQGWREDLDESSTGNNVGAGGAWDGDTDEGWDQDPWHGGEQGGEFDEEWEWVSWDSHQGFRASHKFWRDSSGQGEYMDEEMLSTYLRCLAAPHGRASLYLHCLAVLQLELESGSSLTTREYFTRFIRILRHCRRTAFSTFGGNMLRDFLLNQAKAFGAQHYRVRLTGDCVLSYLITEVIRGGFFDAHHYGSRMRYPMGYHYECLHGYYEYYYYYSEDYDLRLLRHDGPNDDEWRPFQEFWNGLELENSGIEPPGDDEYSWDEYGCYLFGHGGTANDYGWPEWQMFVDDWDDCLCELDLSDVCLSYYDRELLVSIAHPRLWTSGRPKGRLYMKIDSWVSLAEYEVLEQEAYKAKKAIGWCQYNRPVHSAWQVIHYYSFNMHDDLRQCWGVIPRISP